MEACDRPRRGNHAGRSARPSGRTPRRRDRAVTASGAGAAARKSIGITVFSGMLASTCLAVLFVPSFYVILQRLEERRARGRQPGPVAAPPAAGTAPETGPA